MGEAPDGRWDRLDWLKGDGPQPAPQGHATPYHPPPPRTEFHYRPPLATMVVGMPVALVCAFFLGHKAETNEAALNISGVITLSPVAATVFWWALCAACLVFVAVMLFVAMPQYFFNRKVILEPDAITLPGWGWSTRAYRVSREDIRGVHVSSYQKYVFAKIRFHGGAVTLNSSWLPSPGDMDLILTWLSVSDPTIPRPTAPGSSLVWRRPAGPPESTPRP